MTREESQVFTKPPYGYRKEAGSLCPTVILSPFPPCPDHKLQPAMLFYVHIPFCRRRCLYCAFHSVALGTGPVPDGFVDTLVREISFWGEQKDVLAGLAEALDEEPVTSIFFGGGTPSLLSPSDIALLLQTIERNFPVAGDAEISMEANPDSLSSKEMARDLALCGINRISLGVQSMDDRELALLGRLHNADQACRACEAVHAAGIRSLNLDLMWGLPGQTEKSWLSTLRKALSLAPDHLSAYSLTLEEGTPLCRQAEQKRISLPGESLQERIYLGGRAFLEKAGLLQYEISNYARPGHECRHNLGYWHQKPYLGCGPSAVSTIGNRRFTSPEDHAVWEKAVCEGRLPYSPETLSQAERLQELLMLRLRTAYGLPFSCYEKICGRSFQKDFAGLIRGLEAAGYMHSDAGHAALTGKGMLVSNDIMARFFAILDELDIDEPGIDELGIDDLNIPAGSGRPDKPGVNSAK